MRLSLVFSLVLFCTGNVMAQPRLEGKTAAPTFPENLDWLNTDKPLKMADLKGKIVLLDFWTYCCINCIHVIPDLKKLEAKYPNELVVIGVHSAKFTTEKGTDNIREAILRYEIEHPVVNDADFQIWKSYGVRAWPSFMFIDPAGNVVATHSGEGVFELFDSYIASMIEHWDKQKKLDRTPIKFGKLEKDKAPRTLLSFPGKLAIDSASQRLYISDSNHNRIVSVNLKDNTVADVIGSGAVGLKDGTYADAQFFRPQGLHFHQDALYVADTENHAIRKIDLKSKAITTLAGTGQQARRHNQPGKGTQVDLNSPWDLVVHGDNLFIAMAGPHQLWSLDLKTLHAAPYAGSAREDIIDGPLAAAALAQPSGIATDGKRLYFADSEVSAVRFADLDPAGQVGTLVGKGLFHFGDKDGPASDALLQHCLGVLHLNNTLYVADTYNNKIKAIDLKTRMVKTLIGTGKAGVADGPAVSAQLNEPNGLAYHDDKLYIADTNNHLIRVFDLKAQSLSTLQIKNPSTLVRRSRTAGPKLNLPAQTLAPGNAAIELSINLPQGFKINPLAPFYIAVSSSNENAAEVPVDIAERNIENPQFPLKLPIKTTEGQSTLSLDLVVYYCEAEKESVCLVKQIHATLPLTISKDAAQIAKVKIDLSKSLKNE